MIALSSLMTTTMPGQKEVIDTLKEMKLREKYFVIVGGGPVTQEWADKIGADGYGKSAMQAAEMIKKLMSENGNLSSFFRRGIRSRQGLKGYEVRKDRIDPTTAPSPALQSMDKGALRVNPEPRPELGSKASSGLQAGESKG